MSAKLGMLKVREARIIARNKYKKAPGVLAKVQRQIAALQNSGEIC